MELDAGPVQLPRLSRIFQHGHQQIAQTLQLEAPFAPPPWLGRQGVNASPIEKLDPEPHHTISPAKLLTYLRTGYAQQKRTHHR